MQGALTEGKSSNKLDISLPTASRQVKVIQFSEEGAYRRVELNSVFVFSSPADEIKQTS